MEMCPCCSKLKYSECCEPIINGKIPTSAQAVIRSRYTAFSKRLFDYIERTHAPEIRDDFNLAEAHRMVDDCEFHSFEIIKSIENENFAEIDFQTTFTSNQQLMKRAALASFRKENDQWLLVDTKILSNLKPIRVNKVGRNDPCPCNSGKKAKKCCGTNLEIED